VRWDEIKAQEKAATLAPASADAASHPPAPQARVFSALDGVPGSFPPLEKAAKLQKKAAKAGFDWPSPQPVWDKIDEELGELRAALKIGFHAEIESELGDILFSVVNLSRLLHVDPALALHRTNVKFERRFREVERRLAAEGSRPSEAGLGRMDALWNQVKAAESASGDAQSASGGAQSTSK
jgi:MazG family protein